MYWFFISLFIPMYTCQCAILDPEVSRYTRKYRRAIGICKFFNTHLVAAFQPQNPFILMCMWSLTVTPPKKT